MRPPDEALIFPPATLSVPPIAFGDRSPEGLPITHAPGLARWPAIDMQIVETHEHMLRDAVVHGPDGVVTIGDHVLEETLAHVPFHKPGYRDDGETIEIPAPRAVMAMPEATHGVSALAQNFYHWMLDTLPRLRVEPLAPRACHGVLLLPPGGTPAQIEILRLLAGAGHPIALLAEGYAARVGSLRFVPNLAGYGFAPNPGLGPFFDHLQTLLGAKPGRPARFYIVRRDSPKRSLLNEEAVAGVVRGYGFEPVVLTGLPLAEQAALFARATHLVAPHGAGLANLMFSRPGSTLLELHMGDYLNWSFRYLAALRGVRYGCLVGAAEPADAERWVHARRWSAPLDRLRAVLDSPEFWEPG
jgi:capsular polysaccharide biosynthesis protein